MRTIVLTGGGTAGHIMPNLALLPELKKYFNKIYYLGAKNSMEEKIISEYEEIEFISIPVTKLVRKFTFKNLAIPFKLIGSICKTKKILKALKSDVIFCKGGFVSVPVAIAGKSCKVPVISHESDLSMGLANKIILKFAKVMCTSFEDTTKISKKCVTTGSPIRNQIFKGNKQNVLSKFKPNLNKPTILFLGGSLGSKNINSLVEKSIDKLCKNYNVLHILGKGNSNNIKISNYYSTEFTNQIEDFFDASDIVISRGGANSLFELLALNKKMLIIPLSKAQSRGDQIENAEYFKKRYNSSVLLEENATPESLLIELEKLSKNKATNLSIKSNKNSNEQIVSLILKNTKNVK